MTSGVSLVVVFRSYSKQNVGKPANRRYAALDRSSWS